MKILLISDSHRGFSQSTAAIHERWYREVLSKLDYDLLVLAGDLGSSNRRHLEAALRFFRRVAGGRPVAAVLGNHDFWDSGTRNLLHLRDLQRQWMRQNEIVYLEDSPLRLGDSLIVGWDGWYGMLPESSNDPKWMPPFVPAVNDYGRTPGATDPGPAWMMGLDEWMRKKEKAALARVISQIDAAKKSDSPPKHIVAVTHFPCVPHLTDHTYSANPVHFQFIAGRADILLMGHSHRRVDGITADGVRLYNCGSDYESPRYLVIELP